jgi:hypothetical protein
VNSRPYAACLVAASLTVGGVVLSGCSGDGDPPATSTSTSSTSSSSSTTTTPSTTTTSATTSPVKLPPEATKHTEKGAEAFVEFFVEQSNDAWTKPDATLLPPLSDPGCLSCQALQKTATNLVAKKQKYRSAPMTITKIGAVGGAPSGQQYVRVLGTQNRVEVVDSEGTVVLMDPKQSVALTASAVWREGRWLIYDMG